jgi:predicted ATP-dependent endonuclease of OLD family
MITTFKITDQKAIRLAECVSVPNVMIIYGQNGVGKSTLLHALKLKIPENHVGRENVICISPSVPFGTKESFDGIVSVLSQLEIARRNIIAASSLLDQNNRCPISEQNSRAYVYEPLNKLLSILLPHLRFKGCDVADPDSPKCIFNRTRNDTSSTSSEVDIDKLSRLEIDVILLFLPLLEHQIRRRLVPRIEGRSKSDHDDIVVLMDIPNLLVPPQLQAALLEHFRSIVRQENENIQFIIVTSSSILIDKATTEEAFKLMPSQQLAQGCNQLVKA